MISLKVYLEEIKNGHKIDITAGPAKRLVRSIVHDEKPPLILNEYRNVLSKSYQSLQEFIDNTHKIVSKLQDKTELNSKFKSSQNPVNSTIPGQESINTIGLQKKRTKRKPCLFCAGSHASSICHLFTTLEARQEAFFKRQKKQGCKKCILEHAKGQTCLDCTVPNCSDKKSHGTLACPVRMKEVKLKNSKVVYTLNIQHFQA